MCYWIPKPKFPVIILRRTSVWEVSFSQLSVLDLESSFKDLISLVTSDSGSKVLEAHRVVLAACSNFFKQILRRQSRSYPPNPFIFLRGISFEDLAAVLEFMYHGEVKVSSEKLGSFLAVAEELQIKGLTNRKNAQVVSRSVNDVVKIARPTTGTTFLTIGLQYFISLLPTYPLIHPDLRACLNLPISCFLPTFFKLLTLSLRFVHFYLNISTADPGQVSVLFFRLSYFSR